MHHRSHYIECLSGRLGLFLKTFRGHIQLPRDRRETRQQRIVPFAGDAVALRQHGCITPSEHVHAPSVKEDQNACAERRNGTSEPPGLVDPWLLAEFHGGWAAPLAAFFTSGDEQPVCASGE